MPLDSDPGWTRTVVGGRPLWRHSGITFVPVPGGTFRMGLSAGEEAALRAIDLGALDALDALDVAALRPVRAVTVGPFLMARHPLTVAQVRHWLPDYEDEYADDDAPDVAARLEDDLDDLLAALPFRLPSEAEWEYACRAGTTTLTWRGDAMPVETDLIDRFADEADVRASQNPFGLAAMGSLFELCADAYRPGYTGAPADATPRAGDGPRVVRGGAADMSPWQDAGEWRAMLSATRSPHDMFAAVRPVAGLSATMAVPHQRTG